MCIFLYRVYEKSGKINKTQKKTKKKTIKPKKTQPLPYKAIKGQTGIGFFWVTPPLTVKFRIIFADSFMYLQFDIIR